MEPADIDTKIKCKPIMRGGFYLHDSTKGYSHGCIEVASAFFTQLRMYSRDARTNKLILKVRYQPGRATNGGTRI